MGESIVRMPLAFVQSYSGRPSSTEPHLSATGAVSCRPHFASLPAPRRISAVSPHHILFAYHLSLRPRHLDLSVYHLRLDVYCLAPTCFAAVDICLSYNPGSPCFLSAPLIHPFIHPAVHIALPVNLPLPLANSVSTVHRTCTS